MSELLETVDIEGLQRKFRIYNAISGQVEPFRPLHPPKVGMYVCGPTVYGDVHLGNIRTFLSFDVLQRFLNYMGYALRYVRNITDVGHLTEEIEDRGEDKVEQAARTQRLEPLELTQRYTRRFHKAMEDFAIRPPQIEPRATAHIAEQIQMIDHLLKSGYAYEIEGSVYFDLIAYQKTHNYGQLSGRKTEELYARTRKLEGQGLKRYALDFALWKRVAADRLMKWDSPWGKGVPGWHIECSAMSRKYLGKSFDIHGGGMDLKFPHHECELAQSKASSGEIPARYWLYVNMLTINGKKMSRSEGNVYTLSQLGEEGHPLFPKSCSPMVLRFFMLQTHYASPLDVSRQAIEAAQKGYIRLANGLRWIRNTSYTSDSGGEDKEQQAEVMAQCQGCVDAMCYDLNTAAALGFLSGLLRKINALRSGQLAFGSLGKACFDKMKRTYLEYTEEVLGLSEPSPSSSAQLLESLLALYKEAKRGQRYEIIDILRKQLRQEGIHLQDRANGEVEWSYAE